jgi:hypothetical protein
MSNRAFLAMSVYFCPKDEDKGGVDEVSSPTRTDGHRPRDALVPSGASERRYYA